MKPSISDVHCLLPNVVDPFGMCPDLDKEEQEKKLKQASILAIQSEIARLTKVKDGYNAKANLAFQKIQRQQEMLRAICTHEGNEVEKSYFSGSYYDQAYTEKRFKCKTCGKTTEWKRETHSWYG
jgi:hypothetical protein